MQADNGGQQSASLKSAKLAWDAIILHEHLATRAPNCEGGRNIFRANNVLSRDAEADVRSHGKEVHRVTAVKRKVETAHATVHEAINTSNASCASLRSPNQRSRRDGRSRRKARNCSGGTLPSHVCGREHPERGVRVVCRGRRRWSVVGRSARCVRCGEAEHEGAPSVQEEFGRLGLLQLQLDQVNAQGTEQCLESKCLAHPPLQHARGQCT